MPFRPMVVIAVVAMSMLVQSASAQTYPTKPIHLIVPYPAGGGEPGITPRANSPAHQPITQARVEELLQELTDKFGGATSFVRAPGQGLWASGGDVEWDNIAVIEVMTLVRESLATAPR